METIFAPATAMGRSAIAIVRVSGPAAGTAVEAITGRGVPRPATASLRALRDGHGDLLDRGLVLWFPRPASATGDDVAEFHLHGGPAVVVGLLDALAAIEGLRAAEPGEFTRRAFLNGRLDLTAVEGVADLIAAETAAQRRQAVRQMEGELGRLYEGWRDRLISAAAWLEARLDFADEGIDDDVAARSLAAIAALAAEIRGHLNDGRRGERTRDGFRVAIVGRPNAGKSSLFNALLRREAAIVTPIAGTTRDVIEGRLDLGGFPVVLADTAGLAENAEGIEAEGIRRARQQAADAELRLLVIDGSEAGDMPGEFGSLLAMDTLIVINKMDLGIGAVGADLVDGQVHGVSALTGAGVAAVAAAITARAGAAMAASEAPVITRGRHRAGLTACVNALEAAVSEREGELVAEELRAAAGHLGRITGRIGVEDLLDVVFRDFCIGK